ncbi:SDR family NAD(P)-dependent oxidoreductase, partial [Salinispira pacifica]
MRTDRSFQGKVAVITGGSRGIGRRTALYLGRAGAAVVISGRNRERLEATAAELREAGIEVETCAGDITIGADAAALAETAVRRFGRIDLLINNAGLSM